MPNAAEKVAALDLATHALLLDVDGTLLDIAPNPDQVHVPADLRDILTRLSERAAGAVALVSGRQISVLDDLFKPLRLSAVGVHGAEMRVVPGALERRAEPLPRTLRQMLAAGAASLGVISEDKGFSVTLHFRRAPEKQAAVEELAERARKDFAAEAIEVVRNKMVVEIVRRGVDKASGVKALMTRPPFRDRTPVFVGDDATDETVFAILPELKGLGFSIARDVPGLSGIFPSAAEFRGALGALARRS